MERLGELLLLRPPRGMGRPRARQGPGLFLLVLLL